MNAITVNDFSQLTETPEALTATTARIAGAFKKALQAQGVTFHALNDGRCYSVGIGYEPLQLALRWDNNHEVECFLSDNLGSIEEATQALTPPITTLNDSELARIAEKWAHHLASKSKNIVFMDMYRPKAVEAASSYNDLQLALRLIRAWDIMSSTYLLRIDVAFKDLTK